MSTVDQIHMRQVKVMSCSKITKTQVEKSAEQGIPIRVAGTSHGPEGCPSDIQYDIAASMPFVIPRGDLYNIL